MFSCSASTCLCNIRTCLSLIYLGHAHDSPFFSHLANISEMISWRQLNISLISVSSHIWAFSGKTMLSYHLIGLILWQSVQLLSWLHIRFNVPYLSALEVISVVIDLRTSLGFRPDYTFMHKQFVLIPQASFWWSSALLSDISENIIADSVRSDASALN